MNKKNLFLSLLIIAATVLYAGRLDKAFEALEMHDYFRAKELFEKSLKSDAMLSHYGLSIIYSRNNNPFYNLDTAYAHIQRSLDAYDLIKPKDLKKLIEEENINKDTLYAQRQNIASLALDEARKRLSIASIEYVIQKYPFSSRYEEAVTCRDSLAFALTEKQNTWTAYKSFINSYPNAAQVPLANERYERLLYESSTKDRTAEQYFAFVSAYPSSPYASEAHKLLYELTVPTHTLEEYSSFVNLYPSSPYANEAHKAIYHLWFSDFSQRELSTFCAAFPRSPFIPKARAMVEQNTGSTHYYPILSQERLYGFVSHEGKIIVPAKYEFVDDFSSSAAMVGRADKISYVDIEGEELMPFEWEDGMPFERELAVVMKDDYLGVINKVGGVIIPAEYDNIYLDKTSPILTEREGVYRFYSRRGKPLFSEYENARPYAFSRAVVKEGEELNVISTSGEKLFGGQYKDIRIISDTLMVIQDTTGLWSLANIQGEILTKKKYEQIGDFSEGLAPVVLKGKYGYIDIYGAEKIAVNTSYNASSLKDVAFKDSRARTTYRGKHGMIDPTGRRLVPNLFDDIITSTQWPVPVQKGGLWGYVGKGGVNIAIRCTYDAVQPFVNGRAIVVKKGMWGVINTSGQIVIPLEYSNIEPISSGRMYIVAQSGKMGIISADGKTILPIEYERLKEYSDGVLQIFMNGEFLYFDIRTGKYIYKGN